MSRKPLTNDEGEVRELTAEDFKHFKPFPEGLPPKLVEAITKRKRGPQKAPVKEQITLREAADLGKKRA